MAYNGHAFHGMAQQPNCRTITGELASSIQTIDPAASPLRHVSRTDQGVHARGQLVSFDSALDIPPKGWVLGLRGRLPAQIAIVACSRVPPGFDPRRHVVAKLYRYRLLVSPVPDPFLEHLAWRVGDRLNQTAMRRELEMLPGMHDFAAFRGAADRRPNTVRTIFSARLVPDLQDCRSLWIEIRGDGFLYHMVRIIVGTVVDVGRNRLPAGAIATALASCRRRDLGMTAPPGGLFLERVDLEDWGAEVWPQFDESPSGA